MKKISIIVFALLLLVAFQPQANATTITWNVATGNWNVPDNWLGGLPTAADDVVVDNGGTVTQGGSAWNASKSITVGQSGTGILNLIGSSTIQIQNGAGTLTLAENLGSFGTLNIGTGGTAGTLAANHVTGGAGTAVLNFNAPGSNVTFDQQIAGAITVNKFGDASLYLKRKNTANYVNTYTGGTNINGGTLSFETWALGSSGTVNITGNATLQWANNNNEDISSRLKIEDGVTATLDIGSANIAFAAALQTGAAKTGALIKTGTGTLTMNVANDYTGGTTVNQGGLKYGSSVTTLGDESYTLNASATDASFMELDNSQSADHASVVIRGGTSDNPFGASFSFGDTSTADHGVFAVSGSSHENASSGGALGFAGSSTAGSGAFTINGSTGSGVLGGNLVFDGNSTADHGIFVTNGAGVFGSGGGRTIIGGNSTAASGVFTTNGGAVYGGEGGLTVVGNAGNATFMNNGSANGGGGGKTVFEGGTAANGSFLNKGATESNGQSVGATWIRSSATAGNGSFTNEGGTASGAVGGNTQFYNTASAGSGTFINNAGTVNNSLGGTTWFSDSSTAGNGTFTVNGTAVGGNSAARIYFLNTSSAGSGTFHINGNSVSGGQAGAIIDIQGSASASNGTFNANGGTVSGASGGRVVISGTATASTGTFNINGGTVSGASGGSLTISSNASAATLIVNGGTNGGNGGEIYLSGSATGGTATVKVHGNGKLDISYHVAPGVSIGSIEGDGNIYLGARSLTVGSNGLSKIFSGVIQNGGGNGGTGGSLVKTGAGTLTLGGTNTYTGGTTLEGGIVKISAATNIGAGNITFNGGVLETTQTMSLANNIVVNNATHGVLIDAGTLTLSGTISGSYALYKEGAGTLVFGGSSNNTPTIVSGGTVQGNASNAGTSVTVADSSSTFSFVQNAQGSYNGSITGAGSVNVSGAGLVLTGDNSYTGSTTVTSGTLVVNGSIAASSGVSVSAGATLGGSGFVSNVSGAGTIAPGNSPGILTNTGTINPSGGLDYIFEFTALLPDYTVGLGNSLNDILRLTLGSNPFTTAMTNPNNEVTVNFTGATPVVGQVYLGGFYTDSGNYFSSIQGAKFNYTGLGAGQTVTVSMIQNTADFGAGNINGYVTRFEVVAVPEPGRALLLTVGLAGMFLRRRRAV